MRGRGLISPEAAQDRIERLCAKGERCTCEMLRKLLGWGIDERKAREIIDHLVDERFIDDARYARAFVRDKYRFQHWGRRRISNELRLRRIPSTTIGEALLEIDEAEYIGYARSLLRSKVRSLGPEAMTFEGGQKLLRLGVYRGYEPDMIIRLIKEVRVDFREEYQDNDGFSENARE